MKKHAFTLAEILITLCIIGFLALIFISNSSSDLLYKKTYTAQAYKVLESFEQAMVKIRESEPELCPMGAFIVDSGDEATLGLVNEDGSAMNKNQIYDLFKKYIRFSNTAPLDFCQNTKYCSSASKDDSTFNQSNLIGAKLPTGAYIAFDVSSVGACPEYYLPEFETKKKSEDEKCWGKLYIDANGIKQPNKFGQDVFIFGLGEQGIVR